MKKLTKAKRIKSEKVMSWVLAGVIFCFMLVYAYSVLNAWRIRRRASKNRSAATTEEAKAKGSVWTAAHSVYANYAYVRVFPLWIYSHSTAAEWFWSCVYLGVVFGLMFWGSWTRGKFDYTLMSGRAVSFRLPHR